MWLLLRIITLAAMQNVNWNEGIVAKTCRMEIVQKTLDKVSTRPQRLVKTSPLHHVRVASYSLIIMSSPATVAFPGTHHHLH